MNARFYDPIIGRFISLDSNIQDPEMSQNFNRYTYALNNPLSYKDKNGEFFILTALTAIFDFGKNLFTRGVNFDHYNWKATRNAFKIDMGMFKGNFLQVMNKLTYDAARDISIRSIDPELLVIRKVVWITSTENLSRLIRRIDVVYRNILIRGQIIDINDIIRHTAVT